MYNTSQPIAVVTPLKHSVLHTLDNILLSSDSGKSTVIISLNLSAALNTIDYDILLSHLSTSFGISETTLPGLSPTLPTILSQFALDVTVPRLLHVLLVSHMVLSWDHFFSWHIFILLLEPPTSTESTNSNMQMTPSCLHCYPHPAIFSTSTTSPAVLIPYTSGSVQIAWL